MYLSIHHFLEKGIVKLEENIKNTLKEKIDLADIVLTVQESINQLGCEIVKEVIEDVNEGIINSPHRAGKWEVVKHDTNTLLCSMGNITYKRTLFLNKKKGKRCYLADKQFGIESHARLTEDVVINIVDEAVDSSYRKGGVRASITDSVSKQTVKNILHNLKVEMPDQEVKEKKQLKRLYINADEDHVSAQFWNKKGDIEANEKGYKSNTIMPKLVYVYEGVECESEKSKRFKLVGTHYFGGIYEGSKNEELWLKVANYIETNYDTNYLETVYLCGDGASWIKQGLQWIDKSVFVLDKFHKNKYIWSSVSHLGDSAEDAYDMINDAISLESKKELKEVYQKLLEYAETDAKKEAIEAAKRYLLNNWEGIIIYNTKGNELNGCSAEGHISHLYSDRMSSRPMGWTKRGVDVMSQLRVFKWNEGNVYDLIMYRKYKEKKEEMQEIQDEIVKNARKHACQKNDSFNQSLGAINTGKKNWLYETMKGFRGACL